MYHARSRLGEGEERIALKEVHLNKCPALVAWNHLRNADFERLGIDPAASRSAPPKLERRRPALAEKLRNVYAAEAERGPADVDAALYDSFIDDADRRLFRRCAARRPRRWGLANFAFRDPRLPELLFRYRARNWPATLSAPERERWDAYRRERLRADSGLSESQPARLLRRDRGTARPARRR